MKNYYLVSILFFLTVSCSHDSTESNEIVSEENHTTFNVQSKTSLELNQLVSQLVSSYQQQALNNAPTTLSATITLLDTISLQNTSFLQIKPLDYNLTTAIQAQRFIQNYDDEYANLSISTSVANYFELILAKETAFDNILSFVETDNELTTHEKKLLHFIITCIDNNPPGNGGDNDWDKKMIVATALGFKENEAQAVFNVTLLIVNE